MQRVIIILVMLPFLFACNANETKSNNSETEKQPKVVANAENGAVTITYGENEAMPDSSKIKTESEKAEPLSGMISKTGKAEADRGTIEDEDEALKAKRARTQFNNGITYYKDGEIDKAADAFKLALEYNPDNAKAFFNLGKIYYDEGQKDLSISYYKDAVRLNPNDSLSMVALGLLYFEKGDIRESLSYYNKTVKIAPNFSTVYFNRGTMYGQHKQYQLSINDLTNAIKYDPKNSEAYINRGLAYFYSKQMDMACKDWHKAAEMGNEKGVKAVGIYCSGKK